MGSLLLKQVADLTGAKVSAPTGKVYSASDESGTMYPVAHPNQPAPKPRLTPSEAKGEGFSIAQTIDTMKQESIKQITIHLADENEFPSNPAQYSVKENDPGFIKQFVNGINFGAVEDASQLGSIIDAQLAVSSDQGTKTYQLFGDFRLIAIADDWSKTYPISNVLRDAIMQRLNIGNQQAPMA